MTLPDIVVNDGVLTIAQKIDNLLQTAARTGHSLKQLVASWVSSRAKSPTSRETYLIDVREYFVFCAEKDLDPLTLGIPEMDMYPTWLAARKARTGRPYSSSYVSRKVHVVSSFHGYLVEVGARDQSPVTRNTRPKISKVPIDRAITVTEAARVLALAESERHRNLTPLAARLIFELLMIDGVRVSEVCNYTLDDLYWVDVDGVPAREIRFTGKGGTVHERSIPVEVDREVLTPYLAGDRPTPARPEDGRMLLLNRDGKRLSRFVVSRLAEKLGKKAGLAKKLVPHAGRHTANRIAEDEGVSLELRQDAFGHSSSDTTRGYGQRRRRIASDPAHVVSATIRAASRAAAMPQSGYLTTTPVSLPADLFTTDHVAPVFLHGTRGADGLWTVRVFAKPGDPTVLGAATVSVRTRHSDTTEAFETAAAWLLSQAVTHGWRLIEVIDHRAHIPRADAEHVLAASVVFASDQFTPRPGVAYYDDLMAAIGAPPAVDAGDATPSDLAHFARLHDELVAPGSVHTGPGHSETPSPDATGAPAAD